MKITKFPSLPEAASYLKDAVQNDLVDQVNKYNKAVLLLPGGESIKLFFPYLVKLNVPWKQIIIGLTDERYVPPDHGMRNERQLREHFLNFLPNFSYCAMNDELISLIKSFPPITILSMGIDGHVASLFPEEALEWKKLDTGFFKTKKQTPNRISLSEKAILTSQKIYILIIGEGKNSRFEKIDKLPCPLRLVYQKSNIIRS